MTINRYWLCMVFLAISNKLSDNLYSLLNVIAQLKSIILRKEVY